MGVLTVIFHFVRHLQHLVFVEVEACSRHDTLGANLQRHKEGVSSAEPRKPLDCVKVVELVDAEGRCR
ncbi:hypothetical protein OAO87_03840 [bacterium]|nr:hypothetical protein [bacterium]